MRSAAPRPKRQVRTQLGGGLENVPAFPFLLQVRRRVGGKGRERGTEASKGEFPWFLSANSTFLTKVLVCGKIPFTRAGKVEVERKGDQNFKKNYMS